MTRRPEISAIVISFNGIRFLPDCLRTLSADLAGLSSEIIVVDNGSKDGSLDYIRETFPAVQVIANGTNLGFARAVNIGVEAAAGEYFYILNQDLRFRIGTTLALLTRLKQDSSIGMIGPKYVGFDGRLQKSARAFPTFRHVFYEALLLSRIFPKSREFGSWRMGWFDHETERFVDQPMGSVMLIPRKCIETIGSVRRVLPDIFQ